MLAHDARGASYRFLGRRHDQTLRTANMCRLSAIQVGKDVNLDYATAELFSVDQTAEAIADFAPDIIFNSSSVQAWHGITKLPQPLFARLLEAGYGPWLPMHLATTLGLMRAVSQSGVTPIVLNAAFPDAVHPALAPLGLSPDGGIGNVANYIPGLRTLVAQDVGAPLESVHVRFMAHHFVSFSVSRRGETFGAPYHLDIEIEGQNSSDQFDAPDLFRRLSVEQPRIGGKSGQYMTAASAVSLLLPIITSSTFRGHSPGVGGRIGGWPVKVTQGQLGLDLPEYLSEEQVAQTNAAGQVFDGIDRFEGDGTAVFSDRSVTIMKDVLGYSAETLHPLEAFEAADELRDRFLRLLKAS